MTGCDADGEDPPRRMRTAPALLDAIEGRYDVLVTRDRNLTFQQRIAGRTVAIVVLRSFDQSPAAFKALVPSLKSAIIGALPGTITVVGGSSV